MTDPPPWTLNKFSPAYYDHEVLYWAALATSQSLLFDLVHSRAVYQFHLLTPATELFGVVRSRLEGFVYEVDYVTQEGSPVIRIFGRTRDGSTFVALHRKFRPYIYCKPREDVDPDDLARRLVSAEVSERAHVTSASTVERSWLGKTIRVVRVDLDSPRNVRRARSFLESVPAVEDTYEKDILFKRRFIIDRCIHPLGLAVLEGQEAESDMHVDTALDDSDVVATSEVYTNPSELRVLAFDIEVASRAAPDATRDPVVMIGLADSSGTRILTYGTDGENLMDCGDERGMISTFVSTVQDGDYDLIVGYNSDSFDLPFLKKRASLNGVRLELGRDTSEVAYQPGSILGRSIIRGRMSIDLYPVVRRMVNLPSYTLSEVYKALFGEEKVELLPHEIHDLWSTKNPEALRRLGRYCASDVEATLRISREYLPTLVELSRQTKQLLSDVCRMGNSQMVEWLLVREAYRRGELVPNRPSEQEFHRRERETYVGGFVLEPKKGLLQDIVSLDFRSLYPAIIVTHNVDLSTIDCECCRGENVSPTGHHFCIKKRGFIPSILQALIDRRSQIKAEMAPMDPSSEPYKERDAMQRALKVLSNSFYGYMGYPRARWYSKECAESVAAWGRYYIQRAIEMAKQDGFEVVYSDTDSVFITREQSADALLDGAKQLLRRINEALPGVIELEFEDFYPRGFFVSKKRYALINRSGRIVTRGLEAVRRDWSPIAKETQRKVLETILRDGDPERAAQVVRDAIRRVAERRVSLDELVISTRMTKSIHSYEAEAPHVAVARRLASGGREVSRGEAIDYIVKRGGGKVGDRAKPVGQVSPEDYDAEYYIKSQILPPSMRILSSFGFKEEDLRYYKSRQRTLFEFG